MASAVTYAVIYDGNCNLCVNWVRLLEQLEQGQRFAYVPMQDSPQLEQWGITPADCNAGMIFIDITNPSQRWQGSSAAEAIAEQFPLSKPLVDLYRALPALKSAGDRLYVQIRDNRYDWFGGRSESYWSRHRSGLGVGLDSSANGQANEQDNGCDSGTCVF